MAQPDRQPMLDIAGGDEVRSRRILRSIRAARDRVRDPELRALLDDVLAGRRGAREVAQSPAFQRVAAPALVNLSDAYHRLDERQRAEAEEEDAVRRNAYSRRSTRSSGRS